VIVSLQGECDISMLFASLARVARLSRRILSGFTSLIAAAQFLLLGLSCAYAQQGDACVDNSYVLNQYPGSIFVSDTAVTYSYSNCPRGESRLGQKIRLRVGQSLYFWFRVQGDRAYLSTAQPVGQISAIACDVPPGKGAFRDRHERGWGCGGRGSVRRERRRRAGLL
jgi:hypothetical protein